MTLTYAYVGIGPRTVADVAQLIAIFIINAPAIRQSYANGKPMRIAIDLFDKAEENASGGGFPMGELGTVNTGIPGLMNSPADIEAMKNNLERHFRYFIPFLTDPAAWIERVKNVNYTDIVTQTETGNPCASTMFFNSLIEGKLQTSRACIPRSVVYHALIKVVLPQLQFIITHINSALGLPYTIEGPAITLNLHWGTEVIDFECVTDTRSLLFAKKGDTEWSMPFDYLTINTGAAFKVLESDDPRVQERTLPYRFTAEELETFYAKFGLLADNGKFTDKARIGVAGRKLFAYDKKTCSLRFMDYSEVVKEGGLLFVELNKTKDGDSTFVTFSRNMDEILQPRLGLTHEYQGDLDVFGADFPHACLLQKGIPMALVLTEIANIDTSFTMGMPLEALYEKLPIDDLLARHRAEIQCFIDPNHTTPILGQIRRSNLQAYALYGKGLTTKREDEEKDLCNEYPATRPDVAGWVHDKSIDVITGQTPRVLNNTNISLDEAWTRIMNDVTGPPLETALPMTQLVLNGYDKHIVGNAADVVFDETHQRLRLGDELFDVQHPVVILSSQADQLVTNKLPKIKDNGAGLPLFGKGRHLMTPDGEILPIAYFGNAVEGKKIRDGAGYYSTAGRQAPDTTSWDAATETAPLKAKFLFLVTLLAASGTKDAVKEAMDLYWKALPTEAEHDADTAKAEGAWKNGWSQKNFYHLIASLTNDIEEQKGIMKEYAKDDNTREAFIAELKADAEEKVAVYRAAIEGIPEFVPTTRDDFHNAIIDFQHRYLDAALETVLGATAGNSAGSAN